MRRSVSFSPSQNENSLCVVHVGYMYIYVSTPTAVWTVSMQPLNKTSGARHSTVYRIHTVNEKQPPLPINSHHHHHHHHHHLSLNHEGRWGTTDDFATNFLKFLNVFIIRFRKKHIFFEGKESNPPPPPWCVLRRCPRDSSVFAPRDENKQASKQANKHRSCCTFDKLKKPLS